jgi:hypothetical protein
MKHVIIVPADERVLPEIARSMPVREARLIASHKAAISAPVPRLRAGRSAWAGPLERRAGR